MAVLRVLKGLDHPQDIRLESDRVTIGRGYDNDIVVRADPVSRKHAQIVRDEGQFYIEDLKSRNHTYVNDQKVTERTLLRHGDRIRICDFGAVFEEDDAEQSSEETRLNHSSYLQFETQAAEKLRLLLEISAALSRALEAESLLPQVADILFKLFRQADRCFIILAEEGGRRLVSVEVRVRPPQDEVNARFSSTIVRQCLETAEAFLSTNAPADPRLHLNQSVLEAGIRSVMCAPLVAGGAGKAFGVIQLDTQEQRKKFTAEDLKLLCGVADHAAIALENARFHADRLANEVLKKELEVAAQVQLSFLPAELPRVPGYEFYSAYEPARAVGGDYYGFIPLTGDRLAVVIADVAGKGVPGALLMVKLASDARLCLLTQDSPGAALRQLNNLLYANTRATDRFVTLCLAVLDPAAHTVTLASAGQGSPLLYRPAWQELSPAMPEDVPAKPLGLEEDLEFATCQVTLRVGDGLILYTDGVIDQANAANVPFGLRGLRTAVLGTGGQTAKCIGERIHKAVKQHGQGRSGQFDDITLVCFGRVG